MVILSIKNIDIYEEDIELFDSSSSVNKKSKNDANNKKRELIIKSIINDDISREWYDNIEWIRLKKNVFKYLNELIDNRKYNSIECIIRAGQKFNYDFDVVYSFDDETVDLHIEFKFNSVGIVTCPQFLSKACNESNYAEYYYDNYLPKVAKLYNLVEYIPEKETYLKYIHQQNYSRDVLFQKLYDNEDKNKRAKKTLVNKSISEYLKLYIKEIDIQYFEDLFSNQSNKIFMCYSNGIFYKDKFKKKELLIRSCRLKSERQGYVNTIILSTNTSCEIHMLLRWKNHAGILLPAWQISLKRNDIVYDPVSMRKMFNSKY